MKNKKEVMKTNYFFTVLILLLSIGMMSCEKEVSLETNARLKRVMVFSADAKDFLNVSEEYEYDKFGRISKVVQPGGNDLPVFSYDLYEYNNNHQLTRIVNYHSNSNAPTGFLNLRNTTYVYLPNGKIEKEIIEYPIIQSMEYFKYKYEDNQLAQKDYYDNNGQLKSYVVFDYDKNNRISKESSYSSDNKLSYDTLYEYADQKVTLEVYVNDKIIRRIVKEYDSKGNLLVLHSTELSLVSSSMSYALKYEYF